MTSKSRADLRAELALLQQHERDIADELVCWLFNVRQPLALVANALDLLVQNKEELSAAEQAKVEAIAQQKAHAAEQALDELTFWYTINFNQPQHRKPLAMEQIVSEIHQALAPMLKKYRVTLNYPTSWPAALGGAVEIAWLWKLYLRRSINLSPPGTSITLGAKVQSPDKVCFCAHNPAATLSHWDESLRETRVADWLLAKKCVALFGGDAWVTHGPSGGHTFHFTLPAVGEDTSS